MMEDQTITLTCYVCLLVVGIIMIIMYVLALFAKIWRTLIHYDPVSINRLRRNDYGLPDHELKRLLDEVGITVEK